MRWSAFFRGLPFFGPLSADSVIKTEYPQGKTPPVRNPSGCGIAQGTHLECRGCVLGKTVDCGYAGASGRASGRLDGNPDETGTCLFRMLWFPEACEKKQSPFSERVDAFLVKSAFPNLWLFINVSMVVIVRNLTLQINNKKRDCLFVFIEVFWTPL